MNIDIESQKTKHISDLERIVRKYVVGEIDWYQKHKRLHRRLYKVGTVTVIILGAASPALVAMPSPYSQLFTSIAGVTIAVLTALSAAFRWDRTWRTFTAAQTELEGMLSGWEADLIAARSAQLTADEFHLLTKDMLTSAHAIKSRETGDYFEAIGNPPSTPSASPQIG